MHIVRRLILATLLAAGGLPAAADAPTADAAAPAAFCALPTAGTTLVTNTWTGSAGDGLWATGANWSLGRPPGNNDTATGYVCIGGTASVTIGDGISAEIQMLDLDAGATLRLTPGGRLFVYGPMASRPSFLRHGSTTINQGALGGPGLINVDGIMRWTSGTYAAALGSRRCFFLPASNPASCIGTVPATPGLMVVGNTGMVDVNGKGVNFYDDYRMTVRGLLKLSGTGAYVAANHGTILTLSPKAGTTGVGVFQIANNGGWYEGNPRPAAPDALGQVINNGRIWKSGGTGMSQVIGTYSGTGTAQVSSGTLILPEGTTATSRVAPARAYGFGYCPYTNSLTCTPDTNQDHPQAAKVRLPGSLSGAKALRVQQDGHVSGAIGTVVLVKALTAFTMTRTDPAVLTFRFDSLIANGKTDKTITIKTAPDGSATFTVVPNCLAGGAIPTPATACVDRSAGSTSGGDVTVVVRTMHFSRWHAT
ncbi:MAG: hypothetical protein IPH03_10045 [Tetrasphaera sp.]|jgi:hypothetical protein|nr:hypothetical protein [Tetrasphaera sp.]